MGEVLSQCKQREVIALGDVGPVGLRCGFALLTDDARVPGRDSQQCKPRTIGDHTPLLPVAKSVNADAQRLGKLLLRETDELAERRHVAWAA